MPSLKDKLAGVEESTGGFSDIEPGAYKLVITKVEPHEDREFVKIYWDVADGPRKGAYAKSQYPPSDVISWRDTAFGTLKMKLHRLDMCNPGRFHAINDANGKFVSLQEFEHDDWSAFNGRFFAAVVRRRLYKAGPNSKSPGADRTQMEVALWLTPEELRDHDWSESLLRDNDQRDKGQQPQQQVATVPDTYQPNQSTDLYAEDVPF